MERIIASPNCAIPVFIESINCGIYRCGIFRSNGEPIPPHASQSECNHYIINNLIYGCGSPFKYDGVSQPIICDYI